MCMYGRMCVVDECVSACGMFARMCVCVVRFLGIMELGMEEIDCSLFLINLKSSRPEGPRPQLDWGSAIAPQ